MVALILDEDARARKLLRSHLLSLGYRGVIEASDLDELLVSAPRNLDQVRVVLASASSRGSFLTPLLDFLSQNPVFDLAPLILMFSGFSTKRRIHPRVDGALVKPFGLKEFEKEMAQAHARRAALRKSILLIGERYFGELLKSLARKKSAFHWTEVQHADDLSGMEFKFGSILIDPTSHLANDPELLSRFKRTPLGQATPVAVLTQDPKVVLPLRNTLDLFVRLGKRDESMEDQWDRLLMRLSSRLRSDWFVRKYLAQVRDASKHRDFGFAKKFLKQALTADVLRWECHEAAGDLSKAMGNARQATLHFEEALETNPCSPRANLGILSTLSEGSSRQQEAAHRALTYCPAHPQTVQAAGRIKD